MRTKMEIPWGHPQAYLVHGLAMELMKQGHGGSTREEAAAMIKQWGFWAYVGGCHVAIHALDAKGQPKSDRLAIVTHYGMDWN